MAATKYPYYGTMRIEHVKFVTVFWCGYCEREFLVKLKENQNDPSYECPKCKVANKFNIKWHAME